MDIFDKIESLSYKLADKIGKDDSCDDIELYQYAIFSILSELFSVVSGILLSIVCRCVLQYIIINIVFIFMRRGSGGYHAQTFKDCYFTCLIMFIIGALAAKFFIEYYLLFFIISIIGTVFIMPICPKPSENSPPRGYSEDIRFRKLYRNILFIFVFISIIAIYSKLYLISISISIGMLCVVFIVSNIGEQILSILHKRHM